jgi:cytochrome c oxidase subunit 2
MKIPSRITTLITTLIAGVLLAMVSLWYGQNHGLMPVEASQEAAAVDGLFNMMMTIATGLFLIVEGALVFAIVRFRRKPGDNTDGPPINGNVPLEILWTAIPALTVLVIGIYSFEVYNQMGGLDPMAAHDHPVADHNSMVAMREDVAVGLGASPAEQDKAPNLTIDVMGLQYAWTFTYPSGFVSGELHLPVGQDAQLNIKAQDVLHAFWLPEFRIKQDAIPGRVTELRFTPTRLGQYPVICAELCGAYHGAMVTQLFVQSQEDFDAWQAQQVAQGGAPAQVAVQPSEYLAPYSQEIGATAEAIAKLHHH